jgi:hypothetical protein
MDRRRNPRVFARLPVRIWGMDVYSRPFMQLATAEILEVQLGHEKAQFRVTWVGKLGSRKDGEIGVEILPSEPCIWDVNLTQCIQYAVRPAQLSSPALGD